jgi:hypothetical protein
MKTLNSVVNLVQVDRQDFTTANKLRYMEYALLGYSDLAFKESPKVSVYYFTPNSALLAPLPVDYEFFTKICIIIGGIPYTLTCNDKIPLPKADKCGIELPDVILNPTGYLNPEAIGGTYFGWVSHYRAGQYVGEYYSLGGGWNAAGYFRIDEKNRNMVFQNIPCCQMMMEYVSNGSDGGATLIETKALKPIRNYVHWQLAEHSTVSMGEKVRAEENYLKEFQTYKKLSNQVTIDEFIDKMYAGFSTSPNGVSLGY